MMATAAAQAEARAEGAAASLRLRRPFLPGRGRFGGRRPAECDATDPRSRRSSRRTGGSFRLHGRLRRGERDRSCSNDRRDRGRWADHRCPGLRTCAGEYEPEQPRSAEGRPADRRVAVRPGRPVPCRPRDESGTARSTRWPMRLSSLTPWSAEAVPGQARSPSSSGARGVACMCCPG